MKKLIAPFLLASAALAVPSAGFSAIVDLDSTYNIRVRGVMSGTSVFDPVTFDGNTEIFTRTFGAFAGGGSTSVSVTESQSADRIFISVDADSDLFPVLGETGVIAIGRGRPTPEDPLSPLNPLDLSGDYHLISAIYTFFLGDGSSLFFDAVLLYPDLFSSLNPWDGTTAVAGFDDIGGLGIRRITVDLRVAPLSVPEPGTLALLGLGLVGIGLRRRTKAR